ncbi:hypothetical protein [Sinomonas sp. RB5]
MDTGHDGDARQWRLTREAMDQAGLTPGQVWLRYFGLAGDAGEYEVDAYLNGVLALPAVQRDLVSHAVNELTGGAADAPYSRGLDGERNPDRDPGEGHDGH